MIAFGPIPSRRLGFSLGINNIPPKFCSYSCIYCQVGRTNHLQTTRQKFYTPKQIFDDVSAQIRAIQKVNGQINYLSFVPDGEPTLDVNLGKTIKLLKPLGFPIAVFTNSSLIWQKDVQKDLMNADLVSIKIDTIDESIWHKIARPHGQLDLAMIMQGIIEFATQFSGKLLTETMLIHKINCQRNSLLRLAEFLEHINPSIAYISTPTRPPAERWVCKPSVNEIYNAYQIFSQHLKHIELLIIEKEFKYLSTGKVADDLLNTTAVQPMTEQAVEELLNTNYAGWDVVYSLISRGLLREVFYNGKKFYKRNDLNRQFKPKKKLQTDFKLKNE